MRITKYILKIFVVQIILSVFAVHGYALEKATHYEINEYIAEHEIGGFSLDEYLKEQLGFQEGVETILEQPKITQIEDDDPTIYRWLGYGGRAEDEPWLVRSVRHFHNPLVEPWDESGLWGKFESSIIWTQRTDQSPGGHYSWQDVRGYFYTALTTEDQTTRDYNFAETFRGVGQLMHLVEDASVPLHTRNDAHVIFNYEEWVEEFRDDNHNDFEELLGNAERYGYDKSVLNYNLNLLPDNASIPIARIIDTDKYTGDNPEVTKTEPIGIAEYSNANFLSNGTIPGTIFDGDFPYPYIPDLPISEYGIMDPRDTSTTVIRSYF
jgi:hypothetical protein